MERKVYKKMIEDSEQVGESARRRLISSSGDKRVVVPLDRSLYTSAGVVSRPPVALTHTAGGDRQASSCHGWDSRLVLFWAPGVEAFASGLTGMAVGFW
jgi:hypothetical protein